jgi:hypothetical protein
MEKRYGVLRFIGTIYKLLGVIVLLLAILVALSACVGALVGGAAFRETAAQSGVPVFFSSLLGGIIVAFLGLLYGGAVGLGLIAAGDFISLLLAMEENTRTTAALLRAQPASPAPLQPLH